MDCITILAQAAETTTRAASNATAAAPEEAFAPVKLVWEQVTSLGVLQALTFISFGAVCVFYGWRVFKVLVIISFALLGLVLGMAVSNKINGVNNQLWGGLIGMVLLAVLSVPLLRWAVSILGAIAGGILTSGIWYACHLNEQYIWAGMLVGLVAGGMISFIVFKIAVMLFSSLGGSGLLVLGSLALLYLYPRTAWDVQNLVFNYKWFLPVALFVPTVIGLIVQHQMVKGSKDWDI